MSEPAEQPRDSSLMIDRKSWQPSAKLIRFSFGFVSLVAWTLMLAAQTPPASEWKWYKGNLHAHTINSDGDSAPDAVARWYKEHNYNFLALTDHDFVTPTEGLSSIFAAEDRFLLISGEEITSKFGDKPIHINGLDIHRTIQPIVGTSVVDTLQKNVDAIREAGGGRHPVPGPRQLPLGGHARRDSSNTRIKALRGLQRYPSNQWCRRRWLSKS